MNGSNGNCAGDPSKRQMILEQAIRTFAEVGFRGADVQVIADRANVGKGTVYRYFHSKEDLFWASSLTVLERLENDLFAAMREADGASEKIRATGVAYAKFFEEHPQYLDMFIQERAEFRGLGPEEVRTHHDKLVAQFESVFRQGVESGEFRPVDTQQATIAMGCLLYGTTVLGSHILRTDSVIPLSQFAVDVFLAGLRPDNSSSLGEPT